MFAKCHKLVASGVVLPIVAMGLSACGAGMFDGTTPIIGEYLYADTGGDGRFVSRFEKGIGSTIVVGARVDKIELDGKRILIARRPLTSIPRPGGVTTRLESTCEYLYIDSQTHEVGQFDPGDRWPSLKCRMSD